MRACPEDPTTSLLWDQVWGCSVRAEVCWAEACSFLPPLTQHSFPNHICSSGPVWLLPSTFSKVNSYLWELWHHRCVCTSLTLPSEAGIQFSSHGVWLDPQYLASNEWSHEGVGVPVLDGKGTVASGLLSLQSRTLGEPAAMSSRPLTAATVGHPQSPPPAPIRLPDDSSPGGQPTYSLLGPPAAEPLGYTVPGLPPAGCGRRHIGCVKLLSLGCYLQHSNR